MPKITIFLLLFHDNDAFTSTKSLCLNLHGRLWSRYVRETYAQIYDFSILVLRQWCLYVDNKTLSESARPAENSLSQGNLCPNLRFIISAFTLDIHGRPQKDIDRIWTTGSNFAIAGEPMLKFTIFRFTFCVWRTWALKKNDIAWIYPPGQKLANAREPMLEFTFLCSPLTLRVNMQR